MKSPRCPRCNAETEEGFLIDRGQNAARVARWAAGAPSFWLLDLLRMRGRRTLPVRSWRCRRCGHLESYAVEPAG